MSVVLSVLVVLGFASLLHVLRLPDHARDVGARSSESLRVLRDPDMDEDSKARVMRRQAGRLFVLFGTISLGSALALAIPLGAVWLLEQLGLASVREVISVLERPDFLAGTVIFGGAVYLVLHRLRG